MSLFFDFNDWIWLCQWLKQMHVFSCRLRLLSLLWLYTSRNHEKRDWRDTHISHPLPIHPVFLTLTSDFICSFSFSWRWLSDASLSVSVVSPLLWGCWSNSHLCFSSPNDLWRLVSFYCKWRGTSEIRQSLIYCQWCTYLWLLWNTKNWPPLKWWWLWWLKWSHFGHFHNLTEGRK